MTLEIQVLAWDRHKNVAGLNRLKGSQPSSPVDNWITNNTYIVYKCMIKEIDSLLNVIQNVKKILFMHCFNFLKVTIYS